MAPAALIVVTALLSSAATAGALYLLWRRVLVPDLEQRARELADKATAKAAADLTAAGEALAPRFRQAVRDGIQDAVLSPPTERIGQTARGAATVGVNVVEATLRRVFGTPPPPRT
jgi:uncharacterized membrane protein